jgi:hypothetical protein
LERALAGPNAHLDLLKITATALEKAWIDALGKGDAGASASLEAQLAQAKLFVALASQAVQRGNLALARANDEFKEVDAATTALTTPAAGSEAPIATAARWERLHEGTVSRRITHVLYVNSDSLAADVSTRTSLLGSSGLMQYISAGNATWLLIDPVDGRVLGGSQESKAEVVTFSLESDATSQVQAIEPKPPANDGKLNDPLAQLERRARQLVVALIVGLLTFALLSFLAVIRVAFG